MRVIVAEDRRCRILVEEASMNLAHEVIEAGLRLVEGDLSDGTSGNISVRCADGVHALITPSARSYRLLTERDLVRVQIESGTAEGRWQPSSEWRLHTAVYRARLDVNAIVHHHGTWSSAVAVARKTIPVLIDEAADIGPIPTARYAPSASEELAGVVAGELANGGNAILLANHGVVAVGGQLREALRRAFEVERLARMYVAAEVLGGAYPLDEADIATSKKFFAAYRAPLQESPVILRASSEIIGPVGLRHLVTYSFRAWLTFASLVYALVAQRLRP